jgi:anti-anti-sigma factor
MAGDAKLLTPQPQAKSTAASLACPARPPAEAALAVIPLPDSIDVTNDFDVQDVLVAAIQAGAAVLVADGSRTTFCGCSGVTTLILAHRLAAAAGAQLRLVGAAPEVRRILALTRADNELDTYPDLAAALSGRPGRQAAPEPTWATG